MERTYPRQLTLKDGKTIQIRPMREGDETQLIQFFGALPASEIQFQNKDVRDSRVVRGFTAAPDPVRVWCLLALSDDRRIVGNATLHMAHFGWRRHLGEIRVVVAPELQRRGLATILIRELIVRASANQLAKIETKLLGSQLRVKSAFERLGFQEEARLKGHALDLEGQQHDWVIMTASVDGLLNTPEDAMWDAWGALMTEQDGGFSRGH
jgi:RimJ/RimL family protein N-acetyltransferase